MAGGGSSNTGGGSPTIVTGVPSQAKPLNLLDAVSEIQQMCALEKKMTEEEYMDKNFFTVKQKLDFMAVGLRNAFLHFLFTLIATPIAIGVLHNLIHLFGDYRITAFDEAYAVFLSFSLSIGFGLFLSSLKDCYIGVLSKSMINSLFSGLIIGELIKVATTAAIYAVIYLSITPQSIVSLLSYLSYHLQWLMVRLHPNYNAIFNWLMAFRDVFPLSTVFVFLSGVFMVGIPATAIYVTALIRRRMSEEL